MKRSLLFFILIIGLVATLAVPAMASDRAVTVRIEGAVDTLFYGEVELDTQGSYSVLDILKRVNEADNGVTIEGLSAGYITAVNGEKAARTAEGWDGFGVRVDGVYLPYDKLASTKASRGSEILVYYADEFGAGLLIPMVDAANIRHGELRFFAEVPEENGGYVIAPIVGAEVHWYCGDAYATYTTDEEGRVTVEEALLMSGDHRVSISKLNEEGVPMLLRLSPDYTVNIPTDVGDSPALYICIALLTVSAIAFAVLLTTTLKRKRTHE